MNQINWSDPLTHAILGGLVGSVVGVLGSFGLVRYQAKKAHSAEIEVVAHSLLSALRRVLAQTGRYYREGVSCPVLYEIDQGGQSGTNYYRMIGFLFDKCHALAGSRYSTDLVGLVNELEVCMLKGVHRALDGTVLVQAHNKLAKRLGKQQIEKKFDDDPDPAPHFA
jgi:hypothetical protein